MVMLQMNIKCVIMAGPLVTRGGGNVLFFKFIQYNYSTEGKGLFSIIMGQKKVRPDMSKDYVHQGTN